MKKLQLILPMLAFIFAIGMSFAFVGATGENYYASGFVEIDGDSYPVEVNCDAPSTITCQVNIQGLPNNPYTVTDAFGAPILDGTEIIQTIPDPR